MLFDDRKFPYHLMLQNFVIHGGHDAFFHCFKMAIGQNLDFWKSSELPDGIVEFLDSWLLLLEKMTNPQSLLDSPHSLPAKADARNSSFVPFDPVQFLIRTHKVSCRIIFYIVLNLIFIILKKTFVCILELWNDKLFQLNSESIINSLLTILSHLLKGESIIEKYIKDSNSASTSTDAQTKSTGASAPAPASSSIFQNNPLAPGLLEPIIVPRLSRPPNPEPAGEDLNAQSRVIDILVDMGFTRDMASDALSHTSNDVEQAAEWLISHSTLVRPSSVSLYAIWQLYNI